MTKMSLEKRKQLGYWFFLIAGIIGVAMQMLMYYQQKLELNTSTVMTTVVFTVFVFKPSLLVDLATLLISKKTGNDKQ